MNTNKYLLWGILGGLFLIPFIPLIIANHMFFPFITGKNFTFRVLVEIIFGLWIILALRREEYRPKLTLLLQAFAIFVVVIALADIFGENPFKSFWSNFERMEGFVTLLHLFAYFLVMGAVLRTEKMWTRLLGTSLFASLLVTGYGFLQLINPSYFTVHQGGARLDASLGNATYLAVYLIFHMFFALLFILRSKNIGAQFGLGFIIFLQGIILYHTATRGAILGFLGGIGLFFLIIVIGSRRIDRPRLRKVSISFVTGLIVLVGGFLVIKDTSFVQKSPVLARFASISPNFIADKTQARGYVWPMAIEGFKERPLLGWGQENFNYVFNAHYDPRMFAHEQWFDRTHNTILDWLIAGGILGLLGYLSLFGVGLFVLFRSKELPFEEKALFAGLLFAYFFHNLFVFDNITSYILFIMVLGYFHQHAREKSWGGIGRTLSAHFRDRGLVNRFYVPFVLVATITSLYSLNTRPILANRGLIEAINPQGGFETSLESFKKVLLYNTFANQEAREQLVQAAVTINAQNADIKVKDEFKQLADSEMKKMIAEAQNDVRHTLFYGSFLGAFGAYGEAEKYLRRSLELSPNKQAIIFELGANRLNSGKYQEATELFKQAYDSAPEFGESKILYAVGAIYVGDYKLAGTLLDTPEAKSDQRVVQAYFNQKRYGEVEKALLEAVAQAPENPDLRFRLASFYNQIGQKAEAVSVLKKTIVDIPSSKEQADAFLKQI